MSKKRRGLTVGGYVKQRKVVLMVPIDYSPLTGLPGYEADYQLRVALERKDKLLACPLASSCGQDMKKAIDAAAEFAAMLDPSLRSRVGEVCYRQLEILFYG